MSTFLTGTKLEEKLTDIIWNAKQYVIVVSPFIKLDGHVKNIFDKIKSTHETYLILLFGKNDGYKQKSFNKNDFEYFKEFKNIAIVYHKDLHAKHYCNEKEALITSLNLYDYSMVNNIEYGVHFTRNLLPSDKLFEETGRFTDELIFEKSEVVFLKRPQYKKKMLGLTKSFQESKVLYDVSDEFFRGRKYDIKHLCEFNDEKFSDLDKMFDIKPQREQNTVSKVENDEAQLDVNNEATGIGFCIRCKERIKLDKTKPYCYDCFSTWAQFENYEYEENICHACGKPEGATMLKPVCYSCFKSGK